MSVPRLKELIFLMVVGGLALAAPSAAFSAVTVIGVGDSILTPDHGIVDFSGQSDAMILADHNAAVVIAGEPEDPNSVFAITGPSSVTNVVKSGANRGRFTAIYEEPGPNQDDLSDIVGITNNGFLAFISDPLLAGPIDFLGHTYSGVVSGNDPLFDLAKRDPDAREVSRASHTIFNIDDYINTGAAGGPYHAYFASDGDVPEPASMIVWSCLGLMISVGGLWRRKVAA